MDSIDFDLIEKSLLEKAKRGFSAPLNDYPVVIRRENGSLVIRNIPILQRGGFESESYIPANLHLGDGLIELHVKDLVLPLEADIDSDARELFESIEEDGRLGIYTVFGNTLKNVYFGDKKIVFDGGTPAEPGQSEHAYDDSEKPEEGAKISATETHEKPPTITTTSKRIADAIGITLSAITTKYKGARAGKKFDLKEFFKMHRRFISTGRVRYDITDDVLEKLSDLGDVEALYKEAVGEYEESMRKTYPKTVPGDALENIFTVKKTTASKWFKPACIKPDKYGLYKAIGIYAKIKEDGKGKRLKVNVDALRSLGIHENEISRISRIKAKSMEERFLGPINPDKPYTPRKLSRTDEMLELGATAEMIGRYVTEVKGIKPRRMNTPTSSLSITYFRGNMITDDLEAFKAYISRI